MFINELAERRVVVIFCGRFQPFHRGHAIVYNNLVSTYGRNNVYIGTSGKVDPPKSPFTLSDRIYFMNLMGIPSDRILQLSNNYNPAVAAEALGIQDLSNTVMIFPVSQKDVDEKPSLFARGTNKDGSPAKLQPLPDDQRQIESADKHAYIQVVDVEPFEVLGQSITGATSIRDLYGKADKTQRQQIIKDLYGKYTNEAEKIMNDNLLPSVAVAPTPLPNKTKLQKVTVPKEEPVAEAVSHFVPTQTTNKSEHGYYKLLAHRYKKNPGLLSAKEKQELHDFVNSLKTVKEAEPASENFNRAGNNPLRDKNDYHQKLDYLQKQLMNPALRDMRDQINDRIAQLQKAARMSGFISEDAGGVGVVASKKQARDPRYSTSLTKDVQPGAIKKSLRAFNLAEEDIVWARNRLSESEFENMILAHIKYIGQDIDAIKERIATEKLPADYVAKLKQKIADLEQQRVKLMFDPK